MKTSNFRYLIASLLVAAGCGVEPDLGPDKEDRLIYEFARDQVEGSFGQNGVTVRFELSRIADQVLQVSITTVDGIALVDSMIDHGRETTTLLGEHRVGGNEPALDADALANLAAIPEMQLVPELRKQISLAGIDRAVLLGGASGETGSILCPIRVESAKAPGAWSWADQLERF
jgi:hypothetical protein